ncbi:MAG: glycosyltransferase family 2 protein [Pseudomonadota bacterium]
MTATKWWFKRKRVRASAQFAPLFSQSAKTYRLWMLRQKQSTQGGSLFTGMPPIVALVDTSSVETKRHKMVQRDLDATVHSLAAEGIGTWVIGAKHTEDLVVAATMIDWQVNPWLMPINAGDRIAPGTAAAYRLEIAAQRGVSVPSGIIYADDDQLHRRGQRRNPHFKPDWNSELFACHDYMTGACIVRAGREDLTAVSGKADWAQQLVVQAVRSGQEAEDGAPTHLRQMLHHRAKRIAPNMPGAPIVASRNLPPVTIIVPTRNRVDLLRTCLNGVAATDYPDIDVIVVDNDSDDAETLAYLEALDSAHVQVLRYSGVFNFSAINNRAAAQARGQLLCLLNNDIEMIGPDWLAVMATQAMRKDVGAVGAQLLYPDGRIQHAGVVIGVGNAAAHAHRLLRPEDEGYFRRHALPQFTSAVTAACLLLQRERFEAVGGLDERNFAVAFNDVDLCLRLNQRGWQSFYEPRAMLIHHESVSRGLDQDAVGAARFAGELAALKRIWRTDHITDPFHHPQLTRAAERFAVAL